MFLLAEYVVFVKPTTLQLSMFQKLLSPQVIDDVVHGPMSKSLSLIGTLSKVCNSPLLLKKRNSDNGDKPLEPNVKAALTVLNERNIDAFGDSGTF
jgi:DNA repair and recombination protein RAD54B